MNFKKMISAVISLLCFCAVLGILLLFLAMRFVHSTPTGFTESAEELQNPYIGWYQIHNYMVSDDTDYDLSGILKQEYHAGLVLLEFNLKNYADRPISEQGLSFLDQVLQSWQSTGRQLIVRFFYDWDGDVAASEPRELSLILNHMSQTAEAVNRYSDCVYILQGIFIGPWGEMHGSSYANAEDMLTLTSHLASVTDPKIFLAVRTPQQWRLLTGSTTPLDRSEAFSGTFASRLSLFNDGMLGSETDLNTYAVGSASGSFSLYHKNSRQDEIGFQQLLCSYVPNGGEVVIPNPRNDFAAAVKDLSSTHVSYLNSAYDDNVFSKWRAHTCRENSPYNGMSGFDYISRHLGYRYVLRSFECPSMLPWEKNAAVNITLQNTGFSNCYRPFDVSLVLVKKETGETYSLAVETDTRFWNPGEEIRLTIPVTVREYATGTYDLYFQISDPVSGHRVLPANEGTCSEYGFFLGSMDISILPK